ncbi:MAG TPA: S-adenosylmethionine:tRNA ribosyltransferase-isomerase [Dysgonamonadaceae bacterium]|nr:S-adenosylmethionine:tRNA ribosyltransferase-isomerase [Dysgonamonadaceae bacterium]HOV35414.1 S-adenosylmethionine:tRNA ribosyltransferase-isomerase [Dysgonamonadaceae bacterium]HQG07468.1 S-adenosylmethionine:tRNA ribosyltransferase-isomerase [Dysgonamonadaceae bacterium]HQI43229.1 S-adenosylmethionine:tRNA ribosyltransferase-isomerase [Dysgonamonadaceae bacterium]
MKRKEIEQLHITDYDYPLPDERIAKYPLEKRDASKLLLYDDGIISESIFSNLTDYIPSESLMIFNNTRVIHARLLFRKETGAQIEVFCLSPADPEDYAMNFASKQHCSWHCMIGNAKRWKDDILTMKIENGGNGILTLSAEKTAVTDKYTTVRFSWNDDTLSFSEILEIAGKLPIPPYLNRPAETKDDETYQTVYSRIEGSVAAPTAGLHFTDDVMTSLRHKGIATAEVTLHVGAGTFRPVKSETIGEHEMHTEFISVPKETIKAIYENKHPLVVVGTTSMRTIESLYYIGAKLAINPVAMPHELFVSQWEPYENFLHDIEARQSLKNILDYLDRNETDRLISATQIMIVPGFRFHYADALITNFHQPQSTLLLLISAFVDDNWRVIYDYALKSDFRFLSYGDSSLLWRTHNKMK